MDWQSMGVEVAGVAEDGQSGIKLIFEKKPDIVISDIKMPGMDGIEMLKAMRNANISSEVIFISAYSNFEYAQNAVKFGAFDYILKPVEEEVLVNTVIRCINKINKSRGSVKSTVDSPEDGQSLNKANKKIIELVISYIKENYSNDNISLAEAAKNLYLTPSYLSKVFSDEVGETFSGYLMKHRIKVAKKLLEDRRYKVYEVSNMVGYTDVCHFTKIFKKLEGITPARYREL